MDNSAWGVTGGIIGVIGVLITAIGTFVLNYMAKRSQLSIAERTTAIDEYRVLVGQLRAETDQLRKDVLNLQRDHAQCRVENEALRGELRLVQYSLHRLQVSKDSYPSTSLSDALVVTDADGIITMASPSTTILFHWLPTELIGKPVEILVPKRFSQGHHAGFTAIKEGNSPRWVDKTILAWGAMKDGTEFPVTIVLSGWTDEGKRFFGAAIRRRYEPQVTADLDEKPALSGKGG